MLRYKHNDFACKKQTKFYKIGQSMIKKISFNTLYLASLLVSHATYTMISSVQLLEKQTQNTQRVVIINSYDHDPKKWSKRNNSQIDQMKSIIRQLERKQTPTQLYVKFAKKNMELCDITNRKMLRALESTATSILYLNALKQLKDKDKKDQKNVIYHAFDSRDDLDFNTLRLFINPPISSKKTVESSNKDTDDSKPIGITDFIEKYKNKRDSLFTELATLPEEHKQQESKDIFKKFDNLFILLRTCNEVLQKTTLSELVSELYKIHIVETNKALLEKIESEQKSLFVKYNGETPGVPSNYQNPLSNNIANEKKMTQILQKLDEKKLKAIGIALRERLKLDKEKTIFEQLKESYYIVNYLIPAINLLSLFDKHQSKNDTLVVQCHERYGKNFANKLRVDYSFSVQETSKLQTQYNFDRALPSHKDYIPVITIPLVSFEKEILNFLELHPTLMEKELHPTLMKKELHPTLMKKVRDRVLTRKNAQVGSISMILLAAALGGYYWLNSDASNED